MNRMHRKKLSRGGHERAERRCRRRAWRRRWRTRSSPPRRPTAPPAQKIERIEVTGSRLPSLTLESVSPVDVITAQDIKWDGHHQHLGHPQPVASGVRRPGQQSFQRRDRDVGHQSSQPRRVPHAGADRRQAPAGGQPAVLADGRQCHSGAVDLARRSPDRRRVGGLRFGCRRGCRELHHERPLRGRSGAVERQRLQPPAAGHPPDPAESGERSTRTTSRFPATSTWTARRRTSTCCWAATSPTARATRRCSSITAADPVLQGTRNFSACAVSATRPRPRLRWRLHRRTRTGYFYGAPDGQPYTIADAAGNVRPFVASPTGSISRRPTTSSARKRSTASTHSPTTTSHLAQRSRVYGEFDFSNSQTIAQIAPGGIFIQDRLYPEGPNPLLSQNFKDVFGITPTPGLPAIYIGRRNVEGGGRLQDIEPRGLSLRAWGKGRLFDRHLELQFLVAVGHQPSSVSSTRTISRGRKSTRRSTWSPTRPRAGRLAHRLLTEPTRPASRTTSSTRAGHPGSARLSAPHPASRAGPRRRAWSDSRSIPTSAHLRLAHAVGQEWRGRRLRRSSGASRSSSSTPMHQRQAVICPAPAARRPRSITSTPWWNTTRKRGCRSLRGWIGRIC